MACYLLGTQSHLPYLCGKCAFCLQGLKMEPVFAPFMEVKIQRLSLGYNNEVNTWFSNAIGRPCILSRSFRSNYSFQLKKKKLDCLFSQSLGDSMVARKCLSSFQPIAPFTALFRYYFLWFLVFEINWSGNTEHSRAPPMVAEMCIEDFETF
ncbi:hypothetical protein FEM48_Zijuj05G0041500 [Ziziphus jujuba var. spinosa]|uniref:Uncharacterized protein n=1 Tax=Ziziphus jujuba var. spinosa TaxID=714518 RepID=A0A978VCR3_ZIZJJ|nr:hypothetical protein FEM48_Zijuj05G0041500 [Ziziphus jujuba var. spinosa]